MRVKFVAVVNLLLVKVIWLISSWKDRPEDAGLEGGTAVDDRPAREEEEEQQPHPGPINPPDNTMMNKQWALMVVGACFAAASLALQALQTPAPRPPTFSFFCVSLQLAFLALFVSIYIRHRYEKASVVMEHVAAFFGVISVTLGIIMNLKTPFMEISLALSFQDTFSCMRCRSDDLPEHLSSLFSSCTFKTP